MIDLKHPEYGLGYVTTKYDFNLNNEDFLKLTPRGQKLVKIQTLFNGLKGLHAEDIVHCDIKPPNCCSDDNELQIADLGHARRSVNVLPEQPLGVCTPFYTAESDALENKRITLQYCIHQIAIGKVKNTIAAAWILHSAIEHPTFNIDRQAAKFTVASLLLKVNSEKLISLGIDTDLYQEEKDLLIKHPSELKSRRLNLAKFELTKGQMEQLQEEAIALCKRHDVFGLALTALCTLMGIGSINPKTSRNALIRNALSKLSKDHELFPVNSELVKLFKEMLSKNGEKRPTIQQATARYDEIVQKYMASTSSNDLPTRDALLKSTRDTSLKSINETRAATAA